MYLVCCKILGVKPGSNQETIKAAYRRSAKELHPDVNASERASEYFMILKNAYEYLLKHPHTAEEALVLQRIEFVRQRIREQRAKGKEFPHRNYVVERYTLTEVLKKSLTARIIYIIFHILFLSIGLILMIRSVYDVIYHSVDNRTPVFTAYFTVSFGFLFGIVFTAIFLYTGILFIRNR